MNRELSNSKSVTKRRPWPPKRRIAQAARCRKHKPWRFSTGPRTVEGKMRAARNGWGSCPDSLLLAAANKYIKWYRALLRIYKIKNRLERATQSHERFELAIKLVQATRKFRD